MNKKILKEYITEILLESEEDTRSDSVTFGDLKSFLGMTKNKKRGVKFLKFIAKTASGGTIDMLNMVDGFTESAVGEIINNFKTPEKILAKIYGVNNNEKIKRMSLPKEVSLLIDDKIEEKFIHHLLKKIKNESDEKEIPENYVQEEFENYTKQLLGSFAKKS